MKDILIELKGVSKTFDGHFVINDISLTIYKGEFLTLLGPSGCGKTTLLRILSGFEQPTTGEVYINGRNAIGLTPQERHINTVFQSYALFPHMTVFENVAFGLRCQGVPKQEINTRVEEALKMVKLASFAARKPAQLSGGQQQRVAIARAVINRPLVLLLDEPLSSLDYRLRKTMQLELKQLQRKLGICFIFVTHDQEEALSMSDRVVIMHEGLVAQVGTPREVYEEPASLAVAQFIGEVNIFESKVVAVNDKVLTVNVEGYVHQVKNTGKFAVDQPLHVLVRPEDLRVWGEAMDASNTIANPPMPARIEEVIYKGTTIDLMVRLESNKLLAATEFFDEDADRVEYTIGQKVWVTWVPGWEVLMPYVKA